MRTWKTRGLSPAGGTRCWTSFIPELLGLLELKGCIVTNDATGCQKDIGQGILDRGADYVLAVKQNHGRLYEDLKDLFEEAEATALRRWSVQDEVGQPAAHWRQVPGARSRPLARTIGHTEGVHRFLGALLRQASEAPGCRVIQVSPPHHSTRYFQHRGDLRSVHPDAFGVVRVRGKTFPFFLEWERRAVHPSTMAGRLAPYLRYFSSNQPLDDHGHRLLVLVVFDDFIAEGNFLGVARREMQRAGVDVPLWISHTGLLETAGPLGKAWRSPDVLEPGCPFR